MRKGSLAGISMFDTNTGIISFVLIISQEVQCLKELETQEVFYSFTEGKHCRKFNVCPRSNSLSLVVS